MELSSGWSLTIFLGLNVLAAQTGVWFRPDAWYQALEKPGWRPPDWLFGPAWAVLYTLNAVAGWLVWERDGVGAPIVVYLISLGFNAGWSAIFFGLRRIDWALAWIAALWLSIAAVIVLFAPVSSTAAFLLLPYLAWVAFATALNGAIWRLNRARPIAG